MGATTSTGAYPMIASAAGGSGAGLLLPSSAAMGAGAAGSGGGPGGGGGSSGGPHFREQRRKRVTGFATLKRKFIRRRRSSKACDHARVLRDFVSDWTPLELAALCEEYEALSALRDLSVQAELARPPATTFKQDLAALYDMKSCTDCDLVFRGSIFPVHRSLLSSRCAYFRDLLAGCPGFGARICLELPSSPIDVQMFSSLLRYLYTGDLCPHDPSIDISLLRQLGDDFGTPNPLEHDLRYLLETGDYADAALVFTAADSSNDVAAFHHHHSHHPHPQQHLPQQHNPHRPDSSSNSSEYGFRSKLELPCHKAILSARSPFFRNLIARRTRNLDLEYSERALHVPTRIVLDETVIPKRYARVLLHAIYLDTVDLTLILRGAGSGNAAGSLGEVHALTNTGRARPTPLEEAMELYQIGRFLELDILAQGCEDLILEWLSLDTLSTVLKWGSQAYGSAWVFRQACQYMREEFAAITSSHVLHQLDKTQLLHVLQSNFLQASELEVLQAVLKWGEQELIRRMEDREPNLLSHTAHSVTRKGVKKRDLSDVELREILSELLPLVRMDHVLPPHSEILNQAIRRGLVSTPPSHMIGDERENLRVNAWIRGGGKNRGLFVRPRLFMPYYEEVKALLEDRMASAHHQVELMRMRRSRQMPDTIPDTLYMVSRMNAVAAAAAAAGSNGLDAVGGISGVVGGAGRVDVLAAAAVAIPPPDTQTMAAMLKRELKLRQTPMCQRAMLLPLSSRHEINRQIRLRVAREFNMPDAVSDLLETAALLNNQCGNMDEACVATTTQTEDCLLLEAHEEHSPPPSPAATTNGSTAAARHTATTTTTGNSSTFYSVVGGAASNVAPPCYSRNMTFPRHNDGTGMAGMLGMGVAVTGLHKNYSRLSATTTTHHRSELPALIPQLVGLAADAGNENGAESGAVLLSDMMPDVAMATASLGQLHLASGAAVGGSSAMVGLVGGGVAAGAGAGEMAESLQLDLGDGPSHVMGGGAGAAVGPIGLRGLQHSLPPNNFHHFMQRSSSPFDILRQGQHSPAPSHPPHGTYNSGPPRFL